MRDTVEYRLKGILFGNIRHDVKNVKPEFVRSDLDMAGHNGLLTGFGLQVTLGFDSDEPAIPEAYQSIRTVLGIKLSAVGGVVTMYLVPGPYLIQR